MAISVLVTSTSMNAGQYDKIVKKLADAGQGSPAGRLYHVSFGTGNRLSAFDVWNSRPEWDRFSEWVMKVAQEVGAEISNVQIEEVHNIIKP